MEAIILSIFGPSLGLVIAGVAIWLVFRRMQRSLNADLTLPDGTPADFVSEIGSMRMGNHFYRNCIRVAAFPNGWMIKRFAAKPIWLDRDRISIRPAGGRRKPGELKIKHGWRRYTFCPKLAVAFAKTD